MPVGVFDCTSVVFSVVRGRLGDSVDLLAVGSAPKAPEKLEQTASQIFVQKEP